ncbi:hypothetical protein TWF173_001466 [Orbilia oligospora]|uniref:Amino acid permease/ SLC12A domain-containing protein n=2 Tax=Orbilia oligospora TaxID=2813651 RepID=G1XS03_ARTOA|nr:hypothetical protein AOL_s00210g161 [Orbilia oligospora ATCC 24927]EGX44000.1 hypothetical protein AOL_s00210g161 [Orbilia oligospora ATCC 24927]KAF3275234.1 hypothetical protein TWF970_006957 [Orbilia oligospora]KAF3316802.1 hypothetical protein TWF173_001466 [Orbilia oligospora]
MAVLGRHDEESKGGDIIVDRKGSTSPGGMTPEEQILSDPEDVGHSLHRGLRSRQVTMIAIGGAIGTGLIIGTGSALAKAGPGSLMIAYTFVGFIVFLVMAALGEMAAWLPAAGGFSVYATRFVDPALGFSLGYTYWFKYIITTPNQLTAAALVIQFWLPATKVNPGVFIAIFLVVIVAINYFGIKFFGEFEFWLSSIKVLVICGLILLSLILALGGGPDHDRKGFRYWKKPGAFAPYLTTGSLGQFLGFWSTMVNAVFAYLGTELVGVTVGEAENPRKTIPRAIKLTFYRILFFYCFSVLLLGMIIAYDDNELVKATKQSYNSAAASPFVAAIRVSGINVLPGFLNACILIFVFSASNSDLYIASRTIHGLALKGHAPAILAKTDARGVPYYSLGLSALFCCLAFMNVSSDSKTVFGYFVNLVTIFGLLTWISILVSHVYFVRARNAQGVDPKTLAYRAPFGVAGTYFALFFCILIALTKNFDVFVGGFKFKTFITGYLGIPLYLIMIFGYKFVKKTEGVKPEEADLWSGKDAIDRDEEMWKIRDAEKKASGVKDGGWFYRTFVSWLF